jgi:hypothetical protein
MMSVISELQLQKEASKEAIDVDSLSFNVIVPSKSVKKMIFGLL